MIEDLAERLQGSLGTPFVIERELGGGGMARVFVAREHALGREVVVKVLDLERTIYANAERFRREVQMIARLQHPHIVPVLTAGGDDTLLWYVMPYISGESLRARLVREGALPIADALRIGREVFDALAFAHDHSIVHRDIKPENILLDGRHALVADFGVAKALADSGVSSGLTSTGIALGTPAYMAPEQAMADETTNHRADLYAAGAVLYETLAGAPPFSGNAQAVIAAHLTASVPRIEERRADVPAALAELIQRLMAKNPAERTQSAHEALAILESMTTPNTTTAAAATIDEPRRKRSISTRTRWKLYATLAGAAAIASAAGWKRSQSSAPQKLDGTEGTDVIAVMPLGSVGDSALVRLGRELVVTLSTSLDGVGSLRAVDAMSVLQSVKDVPQPVRLQDARTLGLRLGARSVVHGAMTADGGLVRIDLALYPVSGGDAMARSSVRGSADSIRVLTDTLTRQLLEQIWRHGKAPSSLLSQVATSSSEALRAFLAGEAAFDKIQMDTAIAAYVRAVALDSNFAQAWLRLDYTRGLVLLPVDTVVRAHLLALRDRLPQRERDWLSVRFTTLPFLPAFDSARAVAARYPESYAIQYLLMDRLVHAGARYGIPVAEALPVLERLERLSPHNPDIAFHRMMVVTAMGDAVEVMASLRRQAAAMKGDDKTLAQTFLRLHDAGPTEKARLAGESARMISTAFPSSLALNSDFGWYPLFEVPFDRATSDVLTDSLSATPFGAGHPEIIAFARSSRAVSRGDAHNGVSGLASFARQGVPPAVRTSAAWAAATAAWFGLLPTADAQATIARIKPQTIDLRGLNALEITWAEAVTAIAAKDSAMMERAVRSITDTTAAARGLSRELHALWRERRTGAVDSLQAFDEAATRSGSYLGIGLPIRRAALGRALIKQGDGAGAERLLQWPDYAPNSVRLALISFQFGAYTTYERGLAAEARGDRKAAVRFYTEFVTQIDRPPPAMSSATGDAKSRLARLTGDVRRAR